MRGFRLNVKSWSKFHCKVASGITCIGHLWGLHTPAFEKEKERDNKMKCNSPRSLAATLLITCSTQSDIKRRSFDMNFCLPLLSRRYSLSR